MFTIEQINDLHARLGSARTLPENVRALKALGVPRKSFVGLPDAKVSEFFNSHA
jgi:hypothetical protein